MSDELPESSIARPLEEFLQARFLALPVLDPVQVAFIGIPGVVPVKLYPFIALMITRSIPARGQDGYGDSTGQLDFQHSGVVEVAVLHPDAESLVPVYRKATIGSYDAAASLTGAVEMSLRAWRPGEEQVFSPDQTEWTTGELFIDSIERGQERTPDDLVSNRGLLTFRLYSRRMDVE